MVIVIASGIQRDWGNNAVRCGRARNKLLPNSCPDEAARLAGPVSFVEALRRRERLQRPKMPMTPATANTCETCKYGNLRLVMHMYSIVNQNPKKGGVIYAMISFSGYQQKCRFKMVNAEESGL